MAARKVHSVERVGDNVTVTVGRPYSSYTYPVGLGDLTRPELMKAYALHFMGRESGRCVNLDKPELIHALRTDTIPGKAFENKQTGPKLISVEQWSFLQDLYDDHYVTRGPRADMTSREATTLITQGIAAKGERQNLEQIAERINNPDPNREELTAERLREELYGDVMGPDGRLGRDRVGDNNNGQNRRDRVGDTFGPNNGDNNIPPPDAGWTPPVTADGSQLAEDIERLNRLVAELATRVTDQESEIIRLKLSEPKIIQINFPDPIEPRRVDGHHHEIFEDVLLALLSGVNVMLFGPPGTGKSTIAEQCAEALGIPFGGISFCQMTAESKLAGYEDANGIHRGTTFEDVFTNGGVFCYDEIDNGNPNVLAVMNTALANGWFNFPGVGIVKRHPQSYFVSTANTNGNGADKAFMGRNPLDKATLDRFMFKGFVEYDERLEEILTRQILDTPDSMRFMELVRSYRRTATDKAILEFFTPRASMGGAMMLRAGMPFDKVVKYALTNGISKDNARKLSDAMNEATV